MMQIHYGQGKFSYVNQILGNSAYFLNYLYLDNGTIFHLN